MTKVKSSGEFSVWMIFSDIDAGSGGYAMSQAIEKRVFASLVAADPTTARLYKVSKKEHGISEFLGNQ